MFAHEIEPKVIDEEMLKQAVLRHGPQWLTEEMAKDEHLKYDEVLHLQLKYKNIMKIYHLCHFTSLTKLQLNNNVIRKIEGLENLKELYELDLSFNQIETIEGLETLGKLRILTLSYNRISVIENLDALENLKILSLGNNDIAQLDNVKYLRKFKKLRVLNLDGNPICEDKNYKLFVAAYLPDLVYLDNRLLDKKTKETAFKEHEYDLGDLQYNEEQERRVIETEKVNNQKLQLHKDAFVEFLDGPHLYNSLFQDDPDEEKLALLPGMTELLELYKKKMEALCRQIFDEGLTRHELRNAEVESFYSGHREALAENRQKGALIVEEFESSMRQTLVEKQKITEDEMFEDYISICNGEMNKLSETLMNLEVQLVDQLEDIIKDFERNISDMVGGFTEYVQGMFAQCRDLENEHHEKQLEIALATLEKVVKNELEEEIPNDVMALFVDKDTVINTVSASHDNHLMKIDNREDELLTRINSWKDDLIKSLHDEETKRNRKHVSEITHYVSYWRNQLEKRS